MKLIDGTSLARQYRERVREEVAMSGIVPGLTSIMVGKDPASEMYLRLKAKAAIKAGIHFEQITYPASVLQDEVASRIIMLNDDEKVHGILVQLPLPDTIDTDEVMLVMDPAKDVDGFHPENLEALEAGKHIPRPVLVKAVLRLLDTVTKEYEGKHIVMLGNSDVFLRPFRFVFERLGATFTQSPTPEPELTQSADILLSALGKAHCIGADHITTGATIVDIGTTPTEKGVLGDVDAKAVEGKAAYLTPVPGGVGPMTVAMLMENTAIAAGVGFDTMNFTS